MEIFFFSVHSAAISSSVLGKNASIQSKLPTDYTGDFCGDLSGDFRGDSKSPV